MKKIITTLVLLAVFNVAGQSNLNDKVVMSITNPVLYLGYPYHIEIGNNLGRTDYRVEGKNVIIVKFH